MKTIKRILLILILGFCSLMLFNSCHKYPEDPFISLRNTKVRLSGRPTDGGREWMFTSYKINGTEHSHDFDSFLLPYHSLTDGVALLFWANSSSAFDINNAAGNAKGHFDLRDNNKTLVFSCSLGSIPNPDGIKFLTRVLKVDTISETANWTIEELYGSHLHIRNNNTDIYFTR